MGTQCRGDPRGMAGGILEVRWGWQSQGRHKSMCSQGGTLGWLLGVTAGPTWGANGRAGLTAGFGRCVPGRSGW